MKLSIDKTITLSEVSLEVEILEEATFGDVINQIAFEAIDLIVQRTENGLDVRGNSFKNYSKEYTESQNFEAFGKSSGDVNLVQEGNMINSIQVIEAYDNYFKIGYTDELNTLKAFNHNTGDTVPRREFFGINKKEMNSILEKYQYIKDESLKSNFIKDSLLELFLGSKNPDKILKSIVDAFSDDS